MSILLDSTIGIIGHYLKFLEVTGNAEANLLAGTPFSPALPSLWSIGFLKETKPMLCSKLSAFPGTQNAHNLSQHLGKKHSTSIVDKIWQVVLLIGQS